MPKEEVIGSRKESQRENESEESRERDFLHTRERQTDRWRVGER